MQQEKPRRDCIANLEKLCYFTLFPANIQILKIEKIDPDSYSFDEKAKYIFLDQLIKTKVLITCANQSKPTARLFKEQVKQIMQQNIKPEKNYTVSKNMRFDK